MPNVPSLRRAASAAVLLPSAIILAFASRVGAQVPSAETQIQQAVQAAPPQHQAGATVLGFAADGSIETLRKGTNDLICLADDPSREAWSVACYHVSLEPFMARGRELRAQGVTDSGELAQRRFAEADAGTLAMPEQPAMLYVLHGEGWDEASASVKSPFLRWVIYTPWATLEETGLPAAPTGPGAPWLMFPGTAGAHIMITPTPPTAGN
jgi:hypothetical protein